MSLTVEHGLPDNIPPNREQHRGKLFCSATAAIASVRKAEPHLSECVEAVYNLVGESVFEGSYSDYINETKQIKVKIPQHAALFSRLGDALADFAVRLLYRQVKLLNKGRLCDWPIHERLPGSNQPEERKVFFGYQGTNAGLRLRLWLLLRLDPPPRRGHTRR